MAENPTEMILDQYRREIEDDTAHHQELLAQLQESMPEHQKFLSMTEDRQQVRQKIAEMERNIASFEILAKSQKDPVRIPSSVIEPTVPIKPSRVLYIGMGLILSLGPWAWPGLPARARRPLGEGPRARDSRAHLAACWASCPGSAERL